jgi:arylsulfatase A-like enzyme
MRRLLSAAIAVVLTFTGFSAAQTARTADAVSAKPGASPSRAAATQPPNILFIIMDDVGIDQLKIFGYGGATPAATPNLDAIALAGVRFRNTWSMPECSPSRAIFFEGRYPLRTNINNALLSDDLANSQMSPYEVTTPKILNTLGYKSSMFGKFHLAGPHNNPFGFGTPQVLGWDYFDGYLFGAPAHIDTTIGGQFHEGTYSCGFVPNSDFRGADWGACYTNSGDSCTKLSRGPHQSTPGRTCVEAGGVFVPNQECKSKTEVTLDFNLPNGYYVWYRLLNGATANLPLSDPRARGYISETINREATQWINQQNEAHQPWMTTVSYAGIHTPYQQPPTWLLLAGAADISGDHCEPNTEANVSDDRELSNEMLEALDTEIGNLLVSTGLAAYNADGSLNYHPENTNTTVVIIGDNGTFAPGVKAPFDLNRAKAFVYQTGVWVPLIVAGPQVVDPGREVKAMVNVADLFQLFGEIAGVDVHSVVPPAHILDSVSMMPYLTNASPVSLRKTNFTQTGNNLHVSPPAPCVINLTRPPTCIQLFNKQDICEDEGGTWYGPEKTVHFDSCCAVQADYHNKGLGDLQIYPDKQVATRNDNYKLVQITSPTCAPPPQPQEITTDEFYKINENTPVPRIDWEFLNLCDRTKGCPYGLKGDDLANYNQLLASQNATLASQPACPGDGNEDMLVNDEDIANWEFFQFRPNGAHWGLSSWYDFTGPNGQPDGYTNLLDLDVIQNNLGKNCLETPPQKPGAGTKGN